MIVFKVNKNQIAEWLVCLLAVRISGNL